MSANILRKGGDDMTGTAKIERRNILEISPTYPNLKVCNVRHRYFYFAETLIYWPRPQYLGDHDTLSHRKAHGGLYLQCRRDNQG